jgi:DNA end-binding protein Ku
MEVKWLTLNSAGPWVRETFAHDKPRTRLVAIEGNVGRTAMPRSMWSGSITFGLVNVPVKLFSAVSPKDIHFHQVHDEDGVRIQQKRICPKDGKEVSYEHIKKGYEIAPNQYVIIDPKELEALDPKKTHTIDIESFVDFDQIDPLYFEHSYYLAPDKGAGKAYALLLNAMAETGKVAVAKTVLRTKQYLCVLRPNGNALTLSTLYYNDEVVAQDALEGLPDKDTKLNDKELTMAKQLVESLSAKFQPEKYHDEYRERLIKFIEQKAEGRDVVMQPVMEEPRKVVNLMEALEKSLAASRKGQASSSRPAENTHRTTRKAATHRKKRTA